MNKFVIKDKEKQEILNPYLIMDQLKELFSKEKDLLKNLFGKFTKTNN